MTALVATETVLLALLTLFVVALLRSHAEILRRLEALHPESSVPRPESAPGARGAHDLTGTTPSGGARHIPASGSLLLAFLSSGCSSCQPLLDSVPEGLARVAGAARLVVVTKSPEVERVQRFRALEEIVDVVMSSPAWEDYAVPGSPYFVHVDDGGVVGEGSGTTWQQVASLLLDALGERDSARSGDRVDTALEAAGIGPGHPSLHPVATADG